MNTKHQTPKQPETERLAVRIARRARELAGSTVQLRWLVIVVPVVLLVIVVGTRFVLSWRESQGVLPAGTVQIVPTPVASTSMESAATPALSVQAEPGTEQTPAEIASLPATDVPVAIPTATPVPPATFTPTATPLPDRRLQAGIQLQRLGDYLGARNEYAALLNQPDTDQTIRVTAHFQLAKSYLEDGLYSEALATLNRLEGEFGLLAAPTLQDTPSAADDLRNKSYFLRALAQVGLGQYPSAIESYRTFLANFPWMEGEVQARIALAHLATGDGVSAAQAYRLAADAARDTVQRVILLESLAQTYGNLGSYGQAAAAYDEILSVAKNAGYRADIQYKAGQMLAAAGDEAGAIERWRAATAEAPAAKSAYEALIELVNRQVDFDLYLRGYIDLEAEAYLPAINAFQSYLDSAGPDAEQAGLALLGMGQAHIGAGNPAAAITTLDRVIAEFPACSCFGQAWLDKARAQAALGDGVGARRTYRTFARDYSGDALAPEALWRSGLLALNEASQVEAGIDFLTLADAFPASERAPLALYLLGMGAYRAGLYSQTVDAFTRLQQNYPDYRWDAVGYWLGRTYQTLGDVEAARAQWQAVAARAPDIYYGVLAAQSAQGYPLVDGAFLSNVQLVAGPPSTLAGDDGSQAFAEQWLAGWLQVDAGSLGVLPPAVVEDVDLRTGRTLLELGERGDGLAALERVYERYKDDPQMLYALSLEFERLETYRLSLITMARLLQFSPAGLVENAPLFLQKRAYPQRFETLINREAAAHNLDPLLMFSLVRQESLFEEGARSVAAAQGLAQIIPDTGAWVADQLGYPGYSNALIYRPHINIKFGAYYLDWVRDYLDGNLVSALVGYNAGPGNSSHWREMAGADDTMFVELLELTEPRIYVQAITSHLYHYNRLYGS